jgi:hypothetical protein
LFQYILHRRFVPKDAEKDVNQNQYLPSCEASGKILYIPNSFSCSPSINIMNGIIHVKLII